MSEGDQLRAAALRALRSRNPAELIALASDSTVSVETETGTESHRSFEFAGTHRVFLTVRTEGGTFDHVRFRTDAGTAIDVELWHGSDPTTPIATAPDEPADFGSVDHGPVRVVYTLGPSGGRFQTEWVLLP